MKFRRMMFAGLALSMLSACNQDDLSGNDVNGAGKGDAYMSLSIAMPSASGSSRAINVPGTDVDGNYKPGTDGEQKVNNLVIYVWSKDGKLTAAETFTGEQLRPTSPSPAPHSGDKSTVYTTPAFKVASGESKVVAIVNGNTTINGEILFDKTTMGTVEDQTPLQDKFWRAAIELGKGDVSAKNEVDLLSKEGNFLMTNAFNIRNIGADGSDLSQVDKADANDYNFNLDGTVGVNIIGTKQNPTTVIIPVERVVAKLDEVSTELNKTVIGTSDKVTFTHVALINGNKSFFPIKQVRANGINDYIVDNNFADNETGNVEDKFYDTKFFDNTQPNKEVANIDWRVLGSGQEKGKEDLFYTLENTMINSQQNNAYTTGLYYKAEYRLEKHKDDQEASDVYRYQGGLYDWTDLQNVPGFPSDKINENSTIDECAKYGITKYVNGICYYPYWIRHIPSDNELDAMEFGVVRNNWYQMTLGNVSGIGTNKPVDPDPNNPDETAETQLQVVVKVLPWTVRNNTVDF